MRRQGAVVGARVHGDLLALDVAAGAQVGEGLREEGGPVAHGAVEDARVHVVEVVVREGPRLLDVIDLVFDVGGGEARLDGREVDAVDLLGGGVGLVRIGGFSFRGRVGGGAVPLRLGMRPL